MAEKLAPPPVAALENFYFTHWGLPKKFCGKAPLWVLRSKRGNVICKLHFPVRHFVCLKPVMRHFAHPEIKGIK